MSGIVFQELSFQGSLVHTWPYFVIDKFNNNRIYYKPNDDRGGFDFVFVSFASCSADEAQTGIDHWMAPSLEVSASMYGIAYFDGLRHVYTNDKSDETNLNKLTPDGYNYYPSAQIMNKVFEHLIKLEKIYCSSVEKVDFF